MSMIVVKPFELLPEFANLKGGLVVDLQASDELREGILEPDHSYDLMKLLSQDLDYHYYAVACVKELIEPKSYEYIYKLPLVYKDRVHRIFVVESKDDFAKLDETRQECLKEQIAAGVDLKFVKKNDLPTKIDNIAIVDKIAFGILQPDGRNRVVYDPNQAEEQRNRFQTWSKHADLVKLEHLAKDGIVASRAIT